MYPVSAYRRVRIDHDRNGLGLRELSRKYGYHRKTIKKMLGVYQNKCVNGIYKKLKNNLVAEPVGPVKNGFLFFTSP